MVKAWVTSSVLLPSGRLGTAGEQPQCLVGEGRSLLGLGGGDTGQAGQHVVGMGGIQIVRRGQRWDVVARGRLGPQRRCLGKLGDDRLRGGRGAWQRSVHDLVETDVAQSPSQECGLAASALGQCLAGRIRLGMPRQIEVAPRLVHGDVLPVRRSPEI